PWLLDKLLDCAAYAPTGVNNMSRRLAVIRDPKIMDDFRRRSAELLSAKKAEIPENLGWLADLAEGWLSGGRDELFRSAPHLVVTSAPKDAPCPVQDCIIEMAYFDLLAQAHGVGTVWVGMVYWMLTALPELRRLVGIPEDHQLVYAMMFGMPEARYRRTVQRRPENIAFIDSL
ncbi:MAG: nitroreductase family protein, partial [Planctomycetota bacterium]|nr:nitroreductase family protein [Planctomycetota bacterium]